jgi:hypothetical protein
MAGFGGKNIWRPFMGPEEFRFVKVGHSASGVALVYIEFQRQDGTLFEMVLMADDAERLCDDLRGQLRIAKFQP